MPMELGTLLISKIDQIIEGKKDFITEGGASDYSAYRYHCGYLEGLASIRAEIVSLYYSRGTYNDSTTEYASAGVCAAGDDLLEHDVLY